MVNKTYGGYISICVLGNSSLLKVCPQPLKSQELSLAGNKRIFVLTCEHKPAQPWGAGGGIPCLLQGLRHPGACRRSRLSKHLGPMGVPAHPACIPWNRRLAKSQFLVVNRALL